MSTLLPVMRNQIDYIWDQAAPHLEKAVKRNNGFTMDDVRKQLKSGLMGMWISASDDNLIEMVCITQIHVYPQKKSCFVLFLGGKDIDNWKPFMADLEYWAMSQGCTDLEFIGRRGWQKIFEDYQAVETVYRKNLGEINERRWSNQ